MRLDVLSRHLPQEQGTAAGRVLRATASGLLDEGCDVHVTSWSPDLPVEDLPAWCSWRPLPVEPGWRTRGRAVLRPRSDVVRLGWEPRGTAVADDPLSAPALPPGGVATLHYATALDLRALGRRPSPHDVQDLRAERRLRGTALLAYSERVAAWCGGTDVPIAIDVPEQALPLVDEPVAGLIADWTWEPNRVSLAALLRLWPQVRAAVPSARLEVSGRGAGAVGTVEGVAVLGEVPHARDAL